jgi:hypothetical protein
VSGEEKEGAHVGGIAHRESTGVDVLAESADQGSPPVSIIPSSWPKKYPGGIGWRFSMALGNSRDPRFLTQPRVYGRWIDWSRSLPGHGNDLYRAVGI